MIAQLIEEVTISEKQSDESYEALYDFVSTPYQAERVFSFGTLLGLDAFLYTLTILPLRAIYSIFMCFNTNYTYWLPIGYLNDILQASVLAVSYKLVQNVNTSRVYHNLRGQAGLTMFVMYSLMDVCDKFLCSLGHEISACCYSKNTKVSLRRSFMFALMNLIYTVFHSLVLMWQLVTINLASNSYSNALLSFILTNQFSEIKSAVFKRFDTESLFQLTCTDITQRFQFSAILMVIVLRNLVELKLFSLKGIAKIIGPPSLIIGVTILVDWLKVAYIANFNKIRPFTFEIFLHRLRLDYAKHWPRGPKALMSSQAGLPVGPLVIVCVRMFAKGGVITSWVTPWVYLVLLCIKLGVSSWLKDYRCEHHEPKD